MNLFELIGTFLVFGGIGYLVYKRLVLTRLLFLLNLFELIEAFLVFAGIGYLVYKRSVLIRLHSFGEFI